MRIVFILAVCVAVAALATLSTRMAEPRASAAPAAFIDLGAIFSGDENEPDENEAGDGAGARGGPTEGRRANISIVGVVVSAAVGAIAALFVASRLRRLRARLREWRARWGPTADRRR
jgi:hypothetical protein